MTTTPQTEAQRLAASISETLDSQDDSYLTCSVTKCLLQQAATELLRLDSLRLELQTQLADQAEGRAKLLACAWIKATDAVPQESDGEVFVRFSDGSIGTGWATYWHGSSNDFARWTFPDTDEFRMVSEWAKNVPASTAPPLSHKPGCPADGGYGNWPEPCICGAAPVGDREAFEREMSKPPFEFCMDRWPDDGAYAWPGGYAAYHTQCAWAAWQARSALSAGDAVDAQRYRWLMDNCTLGIKQNGVGWILNTSACVAPDCIKDVGDAIDAAMRKDKP